MTAAGKLAPYLRPPHPSSPPLPPLDADVCRQLDAQGVAPLVYRALRDRQLFDVQPAPIRAELTRLHRAAAILEPFRRAEVERVLDALADCGLTALVFKGAALAYTCYPEPSLRPRLDTDLLIRHADVTAVCAVFEALGCTRTARPAGELVTHQFTYVSGRHGLAIAFDVHWKLADPQAFADLFSFDELDLDARPIAGLGRSARTLGDEHALLVACTHRIAHHYDDEILIFMCDIDLLARRLDTRGWDWISALAIDRRICQVTWRGLDLASSLLGTPVPDRVRAALDRRASAAPLRVEPTGAYLATGLRKVDILHADLRALGWRDRVRLIRQHLLPAPSFILQSYGRPWAGVLPFLYLIRIVRGVHAWFRPLRGVSPRR
jgi:hypothetical protein